MTESGGGMRVTLTGASGLIGTKLVRALKARGDDVTVLSRSPASTTRALGVPADAWQPTEATAPAGALAGRDAVVHLAGERVDQRWSDEAKRAIARVARGRDAQPRRGPARRRPAARGADLLLGGRLLRAPRRRDRRRGHPAGDRLPRGRVRRLGAPGAARGGARHARRARAHRRRPRRLGRRAGADADAVQARRRRPGRRRATSTSRGSTRTTSSASTSPRSTARPGPARSTPARRSP